MGKKKKKKVPTAFLDSTPFSQPATWTYTHIYKHPREGDIQRVQLGHGGEKSREKVTVTDGALCQVPRQAPAFDAGAARQRRRGIYNNSQYTHAIHRASVAKLISLMPVMKKRPDVLTSKK